MKESKLSKLKIIELFNCLNFELTQIKTVGELYLVGGAVMCLLFDARPATRDIDAIFEPSDKINIAVKKIAKEQELPEDWLNDAVKGFFSENNSFNQFLELSNLKIFVASPEYLLAMKCLSMRIGAEFFDLDDVRYLLRYLNINSYDQAIEIISRYYPLKRFPQKTLYALEEIISNK